MTTSSSPKLEGHLLGYEWAAWIPIGGTEVVLKYGCETHPIRDWTEQRIAHMCSIHAPNGLMLNGVLNTRAQYYDALKGLVLMIKNGIRVPEKPKRVPTARGLELASRYGSLFEDHQKKQDITPENGHHMGLGVCEREPCAAIRSMVMEDLEKEILANAPHKIVHHAQGYVDPARLEELYSKYGQLENAIYTHSRDPDVVAARTRALTSALSELGQSTPELDLVHGRRQRQARPLGGRGHSCLP